MFNRRALMILLVLAWGSLILIGCASTVPPTRPETTSVESVDTPDERRPKQEPPSAERDEQWDEDTPNWHNWAN